MRAPDIRRALASERSSRTTSSACSRSRPVGAPSSRSIVMSNVPDLPCSSSALPMSFSDPAKCSHDGMTGNGFSPANSACCGWVRLIPATYNPWWSNARRIKFRTAVITASPGRLMLRGMTSILVIEDEPDLQQVLDYNLRQSGHEVLLASRGVEGMRLCKTRTPDLVLLDLMLPDMPGTDVCRALRNDPHTRGVPILMLTAKGEEIDRVVGFELGADDYMTKPFSMRELLLRVAAVLRRARGEMDESSTVRFGRLRIDKAAHRVWVDEHEIELT